MATMVTTHLEKFAPSHILMCHKQDVNITNHSHFIKVYPYKWPTLYTIAKKTRLRSQQTVPDIFIFSLSVADLLFLLGMPFLTRRLVGDGSWCFSSTMCTVTTALDSHGHIVSTYILTVMTLDRYLATVHPIRFKHVRTPSVAGAAVALVWLLSLLSITPVWMYAGLMRLKDGSVGFALLLPNPASDTYWFTLYQFVLGFLLPLLIICGVFVRILQNMSATVAPLPQRSSHPAQPKELLQNLLPVTVAVD